jgi:hypothetical protein
MRHAMIKALKTTSRAVWRWLNRLARRKAPASKKRVDGRELAASHSSVVCAATNPDQWITLYEDGRVRVHVRNLDTGGKRPYRTLDYFPKLKSDRKVIRRLIGHLNLVAAGIEGVECEVCDCYSANDQAQPHRTNDEQ